MHYAYTIINIYYTYYDMLLYINNNLSHLFCFCNNVIFSYLSFTCSYFDRAILDPRRNEFA